mmetsp:Transcript_80828/g.228957  ORF Transcript_80828/g.228957 Transcript_80828/m.228957 type:complete len:316 (-) Transcript_80828:7-954(-)
MGDWRGHAQARPQPPSIRPTRLCHARAPRRQPRDMPRARTAPASASSGAGRRASRAPPAPPGSSHGAGMRREELVALRLLGVVGVHCGHGGDLGHDRLELRELLHPAVSRDPVHEARPALVDHAERREVGEREGAPNHEAVGGGDLPLDPPEPLEDPAALGEEGGARRLLLRLVLDGEGGGEEGPDLVERVHQHVHPGCEARVGRVERGAGGRLAGLGEEAGNALALRELEAAVRGPEHRHLAKHGRLLHAGPLLPRRHPVLPLEAAQHQRHAHQLAGRAGHGEVEQRILGRRRHARTVLRSDCGAVGDITNILA